MSLQNGNISRFSAAPSLVGYLYQCRYALFESLQRLRRSEKFLVSIETLDDVVFESDVAPPELLQTKHHVNQTADLTDASPDIWKTIRIWSEGQTNGSIPNDSKFFLVTTAAAAEGSAAYCLRLGADRDVTKAVERLSATANSSISQSNKTAYEAFRSLTQEQKTALATAISVLDSVPVISDLDTALKEAVYFAAPRQHLDSYLQRFEGWWLRRVIQHLTESLSKPILSEELEAEKDRLCEQIKQDNLPIDDDIMEMVVDKSGYQNRTFVHQLRLIEVGNPRIFHAITNYYRAFEHRSRWLREELLLVGEMDRYENCLVEEWDIYFQQMRDELGNDATDEAMKLAAQALYKWVEIGMHPRIRQGVTASSIARGTYQMLADRQKVGWHPEFLDRLKQLLEPDKV